MITKKQKNVLALIHKMTKANSYAPTIVEMSELMNCFPNNINGHVSALIVKGFLTKQHNISRSIVITKKGKEILK